MNCSGSSAILEVTRFNSQCAQNVLCHIYGSAGNMCVTIEYTPKQRPAYSPRVCVQGVARCSNVTSLGGRKPR